MRIQSIQYNKINSNYPLLNTPQVKAQIQPLENTRSFDTSIYSSKGANLSFGIWVKGNNKVEEDCIKLFRKAFEKRCRKYTEPEIQDFMGILREGHDKHDPRDLIKWTLEVFENGEIYTGRRRPQPDTMKAVLSLTKNMDNDECFDILDFAAYEMKVSTSQPLIPLVSLPKEQQEKVIPFIKRANSFDYKTFVNPEAEERHTQNMYDTLRCLIYAMGEEKTATAEQKLEYLTAVRGDLAMYKAQRQDFLSDKEHARFVGVASDIYETLQDVLLK